MIKVKIYLAEDDNDDIEFFRLALNQTGINCDLVIFNDGEELLRELKSNTVLPDFLFLDINMPKVNGIDCLKTIKKMALNKNFPVIILSTAADKEVIDQCRLNGAGAYLQKPNYLSMLTENITHCLNNLGSSNAGKDFILSVRDRGA